MKWVDYRKVLGIGFSDKQKARMLANKITTFIRVDTLNEQYSENDYYQFCLMTALTYVSLDYYKGEEATDVVASKFAQIAKSDPTVPVVISYYIAFVNSQENCDTNHKSNLIDVLKSFLDELNISYEVLCDEDGFYVFPKGVPEFDNALVSQPLHWLSKYPDAEKAWSKALRAYSEATEDKASEIADKFRRALETFFQEFFNSNASLENIRKDYYKEYLRNHGISNEIRSNLDYLLQAYEHYMNNRAKHHDETNVNVLEYLMYQTGNIMRLLITLKQEETTNAD